MNKELLSELLLGNKDSQMNDDILNTEQVKSLMYHQWKNPQEVHVKNKPDFKLLFNKIREKTHPELAKTSSNTEFLIHEIDELKAHNRKLRKRLISSFAVAASILLLLSVGTITLLSRNQVFRKTYTENIVPMGQKSQLVLPDGSRVFLNGGSVLRYNNFFGKKSRNIQLVGEAYFEVEKNKKLPFIISTDDVEVKVVGTKFGVMAYPEDNVIETTVSEGSVAVSELNGPSSVLLTANQRATFHKETGLLLINDVNPDLYLSWKENILIFDNENFSDVIKKLERWYDVSINVEGTDSIADRYTLTIKSESLREVLELLSLTTNINYSINIDEVTIQYQ